MADYTFLGLVNDVIGRLNEVPLNSGNFLTAGGHYPQMKESVNSALGDIYQDQFEWPFTHATEDLVLTPQVHRYNYPMGSKSVNFDTFRIKGDISLNTQARKLEPVDYELFLERYSAVDDQPDRHIGIPRYVSRSPGGQFVLYPAPTAAYTLRYEYYTIPVDLSAPDDVPMVPEQFRRLIVTGAMHYTYLFRGDTEAAVLMDQKFKEGIKTARKLYQNRFEYVRAGEF